MRFSLLQPTNDTDGLFGAGEDFDKILKCSVWRFPKMRVSSKIRPCCHVAIKFMVLGIPHFEEHPHVLT